MKGMNGIGMIAGVMILFLAVPLGDLYGHFYLSLVGSMETERFTTLSQSAVVSFQVMGGVLMALCGMAHILRDDK